MHGELPADVARHRGERLRGLRQGGVVADVRDPRRDRVEALRLRSDHGLVETAGPALVERAVLVDERVVADVVPAVRVAVVAAHGEDDPGCLLGRVVVQRDGVVHVHGAHLAVAGRGARRAAGRTPFGARDVGGREGLRGARPGPGGLDAHVHEVQAQARHTPAQLVLDGAGAADPDRLRAARLALAAPAGRGCAPSRRRAPPSGSSARSGARAARCRAGSGRASASRRG